MQSKLNILVTGSSTGIGYGVVNSLAKKDDQAYNLYVTSRKLASAEAAVAKLIEANPETASTFTALALDLGDRAQIDTFVIY